MTNTDVVLNAYGLPFHPTDTYVHWTEKDPIAKMKELRVAYEALGDVNKKALEVLLSAAWNSGYDNAEDNHQDN